MELVQQTDSDISSQNQTERVFSKENPKRQTHIPGKKLSSLQRFLTKLKPQTMNLIEVYLAQHKHQQKQRQISLYEDLYWIQHFKKRWIYFNLSRKSKSQIMNDMIRPLIGFRSGQTIRERIMKKLPKLSNADIAFYIQCNRDIKFEMKNIKRLKIDEKYQGQVILGEQYKDRQKYNLLSQPRQLLIPKANLEFQSFASTQIQCKREEEDSSQNSKDDQQSQQAAVSEQSQLQVTTSFAQMEMERYNQIQQMNKEHLCMIKYPKSSIKLAKSQDGNSIIHQAKVFNNSKASTEITMRLHSLEQRKAVPATQIAVKQEKKSRQVEEQKSDERRQEQERKECKRTGDAIEEKEAIKKGEGVQGNEIKEEAEPKEVVQNENGEQTKFNYSAQYNQTDKKKFNKDVGRLSQDNFNQRQDQTLVKFSENQEDFFISVKLKCIIRQKNFKIIQERFRMLRISIPEKFYKFVQQFQAQSCDR